MKRPRIFGHRGARALAPENTLVSLERAVADGADGLELDLRATKDGAIVLLHDATLERTTSGAGPLAARTLAEVRAFDAGAWFSARFTGERVPRIEDVLAAFADRVALDLEVKEVLPRESLQALGGRLRNASGGIFFSSFQEPVLDSLRDALPHVPRALLLDRGAPPPDPARVRRLGLSSLVAHETSIDVPFAAACRALGLPLHTFTVNDPARAVALAALGVEIVISDDPGRLRDGCGESFGETESFPGDD